MNVKAKKGKSENQPTISVDGQIYEINDYEGESKDLLIKAGQVINAMSEDIVTFKPAVGKVIDEGMNIYIRTLISQFKQIQNLEGDDNG